MSTGEKMKQKTESHRYFILLATGLIPLTLFGIWLWRLPFGLVDDAYIPLIYARNLTEGYGIVFYPGGERVEGYTSPLWMLLMSLVNMMHLPLPSISYWLGILCGMFSLIATTILYHHLFSHEHSYSLWPSIAGIAVVSDVAFIAWSASGLETAFYTLALLCLTLSLIVETQQRYCFILLLVLSLIRPEGPLFLLPVLFVLFVQNKDSKDIIWNLILFYLLPFLLFLLLRKIYFGYWLPNTFYAKHDFGGFTLIERGFSYTLTFLRPRPLFLFALLWFVLEQKPLQHRGRVIWLLLLTLMAAVILEGGDHFALHRFLVPVIPFFSLLSVRVIHLLAQRYSSQSGSSMRRNTIQTVGVAIAIVLLGAHGMQLYEYKANDTYRFSNGARWHLDEVSWARNWAQVGKWLKEKYPPETKIAVVTAGAIPYYSELPAVDLMGLNDVTIAHTPAPDSTRQTTGHEKSNAEYVLAQEPQWIQLFPLLFFGSKPYPEEKLEELLTYPAQYELWRHPAFQQKYEYNTEVTPYGVISYFELQGS